MRAAAALAGAALLLAGVWACTDDGPPPLTSAQRKEVSTRYADTVRALTPLVDSACAADHGALVARLADSLYRERLADLERQRKRFAQ